MARHSNLNRIIAGVAMLLLVAITAWAAVHRIRGGAELPPPKWTEADLVPLPPDAENAWGLIGPLDELPDFTIDPALWDDSVPIPEAAQAAVDAELARPEVRALLAEVPAVLERPYLSPPDTLADVPVDMIQVQQWRLWVGLWLNRNLERDPELAAGVLSKLFPLWIQCTNSARNAVTFMLCADGAKRDLDSMFRTAESASRVGDSESLALLRAAVDDTPPISSSNLMVGRYIWEYRSLRSFISEFPGFLVDFRDTLTPSMPTSPPIRWKRCAPRARIRGAIRSTPTTALGSARRVTLPAFIARSFRTCRRASTR